MRGFFNRMLERLKDYWGVLNTPSLHFSLVFLTFGGFIAGIVASLNLGQGLADGLSDGRTSAAEAEYK